jgi:hypothetical protein
MEISEKILREVMLHAHLNEVLLKKVIEKNSLQIITPKDEEDALKKAKERVDIIFRDYIQATK